MGQHETYCSICGGPLNDVPTITGRRDEWNNDVLLLTAGKPSKSGVVEPFAYDLDFEPPSGLQLMRIQADLNYAFTFSAGFGEEYRDLFALFVSFDQNNEPSQPLYIPVHGRCMEIADELIAKRKSTNEAVPNGAIKDEWSLWQVFSSRFNAGPFVDSERVKGCLREPNNYMGGRECRQMDWEKVEDFEIFEADPCDPAAIELLANGCDDEATTEIPVQVLLNLHNRRRIWGLLERARVGDVQP